MPHKRSVYAALNISSGLRAPPKRWLFQVTKNICKDISKKQGKAPIAFSQLAGEEEDMPDFDDKDWEQEMTRYKVREVLEKLSPTYRKVLVWQFIDGLSQKEIAERLGCKEKSVKVLIFKAKRAFKKLWQAG